MKIYYIAKAKMPNDKAHGIQIAKMCESFVKAGIDLELIIPRRDSANIDLKFFYGLSCSIKVRKLYSLNKYSNSRNWFILSSLTFIISYMTFLIYEISKGKKFYIYTVDMDTFSSIPLVVLPRKVFAEIHSAHSPNFLTSFFLRYLSGIIVINQNIKDHILRNFKVNENKITIEPNGVDLKEYSNFPSKTESRQELHINNNSKIALYVGRFYEWKGLGILIDAAKKDTDIQFYVVGGNKDGFSAVTKRTDFPKNLIFCGVEKSYKIPLWISAADVVLLLGSRKNEYSYFYTSPMKVFEYMASKRPIIASDTPANNFILDESCSYKYTPDNPDDLISTINYVMEANYLEKVETAFKRVGLYQWDSRVRRIMVFINKKE